MKTIDYRGGLVRFRIPNDWEEEYYEEGGGTFYLDEDDSPTLRLNVLTFESSTPVSPDNAADFVRSSAEKRGLDIAMLPSGCAMVSYSEEAVDEGEPVIMYYWHVANAVPPQHGHLAIFSLTTLRSKQSESSTASTVQMVSEEVGKCSVASMLGE